MLKTDISVHLFSIDRTVASGSMIGKAGKTGKNLKLNFKLTVGKLFDNIWPELPHNKSHFISNITIDHK